MTEKKDDIILTIRGMSKSFGRNRVLDHINMDVKRGTVMGLMGENGAGKSTMMKCLFGIYHKDEGEITLDGRVVNFSGPKDALENGVAMVHQELNQCLDRSVIDNLYLGRYPINSAGVVDEARMLIIFGLVTYGTKGVSFGAIDPNIPKMFIPQAGAVPTIILWAVAAIIIVWFVWNKTKFGKYLYAVGGNQEAAAVSGISVFKVTLGAFMVASTRKATTSASASSPRAVWLSSLPRASLGLWRPGVSMMTSCEPGVFTTARMTHGLAGLRLRLARHRAGVHHDGRGLGFVAHDAAEVLEGLGHRVKLHAIDATAEVYERDPEGPDAHLRRPFLPLPVLPAWLPPCLKGFSGTSHLRSFSASAAKCSAMYAGARCQKFVPSIALKALLTAVLLFTAVRYLGQGF